MNNKQIAQQLREIAAVYTIKDENRFRIVAYERAADSIEHLAYDLEDVWKEGKLKEIPGIGESIASYLDELFTKGRVKHFDQLKKSLPKAMFALLKLPGFGAKKAYKLTVMLKIKDNENPYQVLKKAAYSHKIASIEGFGVKSEQEILQSLLSFQKKEAKLTRILLSQAFEVANRIVDYLKQSKYIKEVYPLGSLRRMFETVGDIDIAVSSDNPKEVIDHFIKYPSIERLLEKGDVTSSIVLKSGVQIDLMIQPPSGFGALLQHFTGSKQHNIKLREYALKKGISLSEHGIKKGSKLEKIKTEDEFYKKLGLPLIPPELREDRGEIEKAIKNSLPKLVNPSDIKGDLHVHSNYNLQPSHDLGENNFEEMLKKAEELEYQYLAFSEHNPALSSNSQDKINSIMKIRKQFIDKIIYSTKITRVKIFNMLEVDILTNGVLALPNSSFEYIDAMIVSIHSSFNMSRDAMTKRILKGLSFPKVKVLGHPTGRLLEKRESIQADWDLIFEFCSKKKIALEINGNPYRLDLPDTLVKEALNFGCKFVIDTDAHRLVEMDLMRYGVSVARRGWAEKSDILNTLPYNEFKHWLLS